MSSSCIFAFIIYHHGLTRCQVYTSKKQRRKLRFQSYGLSTARESIPTMHYASQGGEGEDESKSTGFPCSLSVCLFLSSRNRDKATKREFSESTIKVMCRIDFAVEFNSTTPELMLISTNTVA